MTEDPRARVAYRFRASSERVFDAWLDPAKIALWFGPGLGEMVRIEVDARVGGRFFCELVLVHEMPPKWADFVARTERGWSTMLEAMRPLLD